MTYTVVQNTRTTDHQGPTSSIDQNNYTYQENVHGATILGNYHQFDTNYNGGVQQIGLQNLIFV